jgi:WD40 repeat protein
MYAVGNLVFTGGYDGVIRMYNVSNGTLLGEYIGHTGAIMAITVYDDFVYSGNNVLQSSAL